MEYCDNGNLGDYIKEKGNITTEEKKKWTKE